MTTRTAPLTTRVTRWTWRSLCAERDRRRLDAAVPAVALLVGDDGFEQMTAAGVGPERLGGPDLPVRDLPQQEGADAHFAARAGEKGPVRLNGGGSETDETPV